MTHSHGDCTTQVYFPPLPRDVVYEQRMWDAAEEYPPATSEMTAAEWLSTREGYKWSRNHHRQMRYCPTIACIKYDDEGKDAASHWGPYGHEVYTGALYGPSEHVEWIPAVTDEDLKRSAPA